MRYIMSASAAVFLATAGIQGDALASDLLGLQAGISIGSQPPPRAYYATRYYEPPPVYAAPEYLPPHCYWTRGEPVWNGYRWISPRMQVCD